MKRLLKPFHCFYDYEHAFTPFAVEKVRIWRGSNGRQVKLVYIFGFKVAYFNITNF